MRVYVSFGLRTKPVRVCASFGLRTGVGVQELLQLPRLNPDLLALFEKEVRATGSEKEQRQLVKKLLQASGSNSPALPTQLGAPGALSHPLLSWEARETKGGGGSGERGAGVRVVYSRSPPSPSSLSHPANFGSMQFIPNINSRSSPLSFQINLVVHFVR